MAYDSSKPATGGSLVAADIRENFRALKEDGIVIPDSDHVTQAASQAEMEAASATDKYVSPGREKYHPGVAKGWFSYGVGGSIQAHYNMSTKVYNSTGNVSFYFDDDLSSTYYVPLVSISTAGYAIADSRAVGSFRVLTYDSAGAAFNPGYMYGAAFGDF